MEIEQLEIKTLTSKNIDQEHICCAMNDKKNEAGMLAKKEWLRAQFDQGYTFKKFDVRGKVFIEYMPAEIAWRPVIAPNYTFIQCLWVSGKFKGHGLSSRLLNACEKDSKNSNGMVVVTSSKPFLTDKKFFIHHGFQVVDKAPPCFELLVKKNVDAPDPTFSRSAKENQTTVNEGVYIAYTDQCPFTTYYIKLLASICKQKNIPFQSQKFLTPEEVRNAPSAYGTFSLFMDGVFKTHVIPSEKAFIKLLELHHNTK